MPIALIITTFNSEKYLEEVINSALSQTRHPAELIVVDNGSVDATQSISERYGIPFFVQTVGLVGESRNLGVSITQSPFIKFLDGDDLLEKGALADLLAGHQVSGADLIYGQNVNFLNRMDENLGVKNFAHTEKPIHSATVLNSLIPRETFHKYGLPDQDNHSWNRWIVNSKIAGLKMHKIQDVVGYRRIHDSNISHAEVSKRELFELIASNLKGRKSKDA
jgi:glycosyltransferase involved in cell wall biosynthesis